jgi:hypothetical protein
MKTAFFGGPAHLPFLDAPRPITQKVIITKTMVFIMGAVCLGLKVKTKARAYETRAAITFIPNAHIKSAQH